MIYIWHKTKYGRELKEAGLLGDVFISSGKMGSGLTQTVRDELLAV